MSEVLVVRRTLQSVQRAQSELESIADLRWMAGTQDIEQAVDLIRTQPPRMVLCDLRLEGGHAAQLLKPLHRAAPQASLWVLTPSDDDILLFKTLRHGAHGYTVDTGNPRTVSTALQALRSDRALMSPMIARHMLHSFDAQRLSLSRATLPPHVPATPEWDLDIPGTVMESDQRLLSLLAHGLLVHEIARYWDMATEAITQQIARLYRRLHARQSQGLALAA
jgi:DNA-binding NarL/FixJ family response regulator